MIKKERKYNIEEIGVFGICSSQGNWSEGKIFQLRKKEDDICEFYCELYPEGILHDCYPRFLEGDLIFDIPEDAGSVCIEDLDI